MTEEQLELVKKALYLNEVKRVKMIEALPKAEFKSTDEYKEVIDALIDKLKNKK